MFLKTMRVAEETQDEYLGISGELNRKTVEEIERLVHARDVGEISEATMVACLGSVWNVTAGLVERDIMNAVGRTLNEYKDPQQSPLFRVFIKATKAKRDVVLVMWRPGSFRMTTWIVSTATVRTWTAPEGYSRAGLAKEQFERVGDFMIATGWMEIL